MKKTVKFVTLTVSFALETLRKNRRNRRVNWGQINTLLNNWRGWDVLADGSKVQSWVDDASSWIVDIDDQLADGQHRLIAFVLAFGTREEIEELLRILDAAPQSGFRLSDKVKEAGFDRTKPISTYVPISGFELVTGKHVPSLEGREFVFLYGADPRAADKADTDQRKRTGADQLDRHAESANVLTELGLSSADMQPVLRSIYLRTLPPTAKAKEDGAVYGSLRKGGNIHPDRYPVILSVVKDYLDEAMEALYGEGGWEHQPEFYIEPRDCLQIPFTFLQFCSNFTLYCQGNQNKEHAKKVLRTVMSWLTVQPGQRPTGLIKVVIDGVKEKSIDPYSAYYIVSRCINIAHNGDSLPTINSVSQLKKWLGERFEQEPLNRLPGWDSTGCEDLVTQSLKNKQAQQANAKAKAKKA